MRYRFRRALLVLIGIAASVSFIASTTLTFAYVYHIPSAVVIRAIPKPLRASLESVVKGVREFPYLHYRLSRNTLPTYEIKIDSKDLTQLNAALPDPLGNLSSTGIKAQPARFFLNGKEYAARVRYRGETSVHWLYPKKSWRVTIKGDDLPEGRRAFDFIVPNGRGYLMEQFNLYRAKKFGLTVPWSDFGTLAVNGDHHGVYFVVEHWSEEFLEKAELSPDANFYGESFINEPIFESVAYWQKYTENPDDVQGNVADLERLLTFIRTSSDDEFRERIWSYIDEENFYAWLVHMTLSGSDHQDWAHNIRLYADRATGTFMFIPWDVGATRLRDRAVDIHFNPLISRVLMIPEFKRERDTRLYGYVNDTKNLEDDLAFYDTLYTKTRHAFYKDTMKEHSSREFDREVERFRSIIEDNFNFIREYLEAREVRADVFLRATPQPHAALELTTSAALVDSVYALTVASPEAGEFAVYLDTNENGTLDVHDATLGRGAAGDKIILRPAVHLKKYFIPTDNDLAHYAPFKFESIPVRIFITTATHAPLTALKINVHAANHLTREEADVAVRIFDETAYASWRTLHLPLQTFVREYPQFFILENNHLGLGPGVVTLYHTVVLPQGARLSVAHGTRVRLASGVSLIASGAVTVRGEERAPITFTRADPGHPWGIFAVVGADRVFIKNATFDGGSRDTVNGAFFTGMVSMHRVTNTEIKNSTFTHASEGGGDDAVNVKYGSVEIGFSSFHDNSGDALDLDFASGTVHDTSFEKNKNDGIDVSGAEVTIADVTIRDAGDKGISIGEASTVNVISSTIHGGNIGIAVKDSSVATIDRCTVQDNKIGVSLFNKKPIFGGSTATVRASEIKNNQKDIEHDARSTINVQNL